MRRRSPFHGVGLDRLSIFVPAIMSVGLAFWLVTLVRDVFRWRTAESLARRATNAGRSTARLVSGDDRPPDPDHIGLRHRPAYLVTGITLGAVGTYIFLGSLFNYLRDDGYVEGIGWLLAVALIASGAFVLVGLAALAAYASWPQAARWARSIQAWTPLSRMPFDRSISGDEPSWRLSAAVMLLPASTVLVMFLVSTDWRAVRWLDEQVIDLFEASRLDALHVVDPLGATAVAVTLAAVVGIATLRCRPLAFSYPVSVVLGLAITETTRNLVQRARPADGPLAGLNDSFPSGHVVQATLIAGLLPLALAALSGSRRVIWPARLILGVGVVAGALHRVDDSLHWPSDVIVGGLIGLSLVVAVEWVMAHESWHHWCRGCVWCPQSHGPHLLGVIDLHLSVQRVIRAIAHLWAAAAVVALTVLTLVVGVPTDPGEGAIFGPDVQQPVQLALAGVVSIGALISWKWDAAGAVLIAFAGAGLGVFAALEYPPAIAFGLTVMLLLPAVLLWLGWQHRRTIGEIIGLATVTAVLLGCTWIGVGWVHDFYFGPTHPASAAPFTPVEEVRWVWMGGLTPESITVTAGIDDPGRDDAAIVVSPVAGGPSIRVEVAATDTDPAVRFDVDGLAPDTAYAYRIEVDGETDDQRGQGTFRTPGRGATSFRFAVGACARTDSNGAVFDAIADQEPLFYLNLGDIHYGNIDSTDPASHRAAYERLLTRPAQASLYQQVPIAYVWDDHDYGPNDSDAASPGRSAARQAYREVVPHYGLAEPVPDASIQQAFTVGRVRFVLTDSRSERTDDTMLGPDQVDWLIDELTTASRSHGLVVWGNSVPWISEPRAGGDNWNGYADERRRIADALAQAGVDNLVMLSGDAHMVALDDGSNSDYSTDQVGGFPVLHAAALDRPGNVKGGPYSHGTFTDSGQYGMVDVVDDGSTIAVTLSGHTWDGDGLVSETFTFE